MKIEFIYTFEQQEQELKVYPFTKDVLKDVESLVAFAKQDLTPQQTTDICKISCCVYTESEDVQLPDWYNDCNGKLYFTNGILDKD